MTPNPSPRGRFAPSPTGALHLGSLVAAVGSWLMARRRGGDWLVRMEDLDPPREVPGAAERQIQTLAAFGMTSDAPVLWQSRRGDAYAAALEPLLAAGLAFECRCSRSDLAATGGIHRHCVAGNRQRPAAIRLRVPDTVLGFDDGLQGPQAQSLATEVGDFVLRRADGPWAYQLAVVVDDAAQGITDVVRGADLLDSTPRQIFLQRQLGLPTPAYAHLPLLVDAQGKKLGKSLASIPVDPAAPKPALLAAWRFLGQTGRPFDDAGPVESALVRALAHFDPQRIPRVLHATIDAPVSGAAGPT
ncbi:MAG: tRNA glutamyl-Q(34) synthetase GluQRS [Arenimonas sp.]|uniref:tRNA glutamyl-Q(34) synthetase GluQRS n=1 Tax=Arenimonas sp. TaxID=1872635 RepID=UPI0025C5748B|nr:tRNA glutamyl-Q(34) synthetase GluQRS [Arenimonas sp.]MBW8368318.1 tRNA glutamyl-Q(34) synthetase GluQRS [Arenimonas sp.]